jgi:glyoxylase-like metal-dependent hydrolase (beta-lactamase superfamily II)
MNSTRVLLLLALAATGSAAQDSAPAIETAAVAPGVHVLYGNGGNIGVSVGDDGVILIDDQVANLTPPVLEALAKLHPEHPRFVINTHWHHDHTGGNEQLAGQGSVVVAHDQVRARMSADNFSEFFKRTTPASPRAALPVVTFNDSLSLHVNGGELRGIHVRAAHTDGDVFIHLRDANVIHTGDLMFAGLYPFIDIDSGGTVAGTIAAVDQMLALADDSTKIIPGHGKVTDRAGLAEYRSMLAITSARMAELVRAGRTLEQVLAAKPFADYDDSLSWSFITAERYVQILYRDATLALSADRT